MVHKRKVVNSFYIPTVRIPEERLLIYLLVPSYCTMLIRNSLLLMEGKITILH